MVVVTQHRALIQHLKEIGLIDDDVKVIAHASDQDVEGKHVIGVLPIHLAAKATRYTNVAILVPKELRNTELTLDQVRRYATKPVTYVISIEE